MHVKNLYIVLLAFILFSCDHFVLKKENKEEIVREELSKLNRNEVEQPPLFEVCKKMSEEELESCFQNTITLHIHNHLAKETITVTQNVDDTIWVPLLITKNGEIILEDFSLPNTIKKQIPNLIDILKQGVNTLPEVEPAHTRSTPVNARYKLPVVIRIE